LENMDSPYGEEVRKDFATLKEYVVDKGGRPLGLPDKINTSNPIHKFYDSCWKKEASERVTFSRLATDLSEEPWSSIIATFEASDINTSNCWKSCLQEGEPVKWETFIQCFATTFRVSELRQHQDSPHTMALAAILEVNLADKGGNKVVTPEAWSRFSRSFSPITAVQTTLDTILELVTSDWFFGNFDQYEANNRLMFEPPGTFLVRFSQFKEGKRGQFTMSYVGTDKVGANAVLHTRLGEIDPSRIVPHMKFLMKHKKKLKKALESGRPAIFTAVKAKK